MFFLYPGNIEKCPVTYSYWLNGRWFLQIVDIYREFYHEIGNIEKCPFIYWLNGRWFLQIVDIHVGNFNMKLTGRWFPQIVDRDSGNPYSNICITKIMVLVSEPVHGRSRATELPCLLCNTT